MYYTHTHTHNCWLLFMYLVLIKASDSPPLICSDSLAPFEIRLIQFVPLHRTAFVPLHSFDWLLSLHLHRICKLDSGIVFVHVINVLHSLLAWQCDNGILINVLFVVRLFGLFFLSLTSNMFCFDFFLVFPFMFGVEIRFKLIDMKLIQFKLSLAVHHSFT